MKILVTGGTGFIGTHLVHELVRQGHTVSTISRKSTGEVPGVDHYAADVESPGLRSVVPKPEAIVHLAGLADASASYGNPVAYNRVNALGTLNAMEIARETNAVFVLASSQRIYHPTRALTHENDAKLPTDPYGYSKLVAEKWLEMYRRLYALRTVAVRFFSVYGPGQAVTGGGSGVVSIFMTKALAGQPLNVNSPSLRDFTYVTDVVQGILLALENPAAWGEAFNIATGQATSIEELARLVREVTNSTSPMITSEYGGDESYVADISKATRVLGYVPRVDLRQGLGRYAEELAKQR